MCYWRADLRSMDMTWSPLAWTPESFWIESKRLARSGVVRIWNQIGKPHFPQSFNIRWIVKSMIRWQMSSPPKSALSHLASKWIPFSNLTDTEVTFILSIKAWTLKVCAGLLKAGYFYHFNFWHNKKSQVLIWQIRTRAKIDKHHFYDFSWPTRY